MRSGPNVISQTSTEMPFMRRQLSSATKNEKECDFEVSDEEPEVKIDHDDDSKRLMQLNFRKDEAKVGKLPFTHWTINRTILAQ